MAEEYELPEGFELYKLPEGYEIIQGEDSNINIPSGFNIIKQKQAKKAEFSLGDSAKFVGANAIRGVTDFATFGADNLFAPPGQPVGNKASAYVSPFLDKILPKNSESYGIQSSAPVRVAQEVASGALLPGGPILNAVGGLGSGVAKEVLPNTNPLATSTVGGLLATLLGSKTGGFAKWAGGKASSKLSDTTIPKKVELEQVIDKPLERGVLQEPKVTEAVPGKWEAVEYAPRVKQKEADDLATTLKANKATIKKSIGASGYIDEAEDVGFQLEDAYKRLKPTGVLDLPPEESWVSLKAQLDPDNPNSLMKQRSNVLIKAEKANPKSGTITFEKAQDYINKLGGKAKEEAQAFLEQEKEDLFENWDGSLLELDKRKVTLDEQIKGLYSNVAEGGSKNVNINAEVKKRMAGDMRTTLNDQVAGLKEVNQQLGDIYTIKPIIEARLAQAKGLQYSPEKVVEGSKALPPVAGLGGGPVTPESPFSSLEKYLSPKPSSTTYPKAEILSSEGDRIMVDAQGPYTPITPKQPEFISRKVTPSEVVPGEWAKLADPMIKAVLGALGGSAASSSVGPIVASITGAAVGQAIPFNLAKMAGAIGKGVERISSFGNPYIAPATLAMREGMGEPQKLPRQTKNLSGEVVTQFLAQSAKTDKAVIAQDLVRKLEQASNAQDMDKVERLHADMTRLFPEMFEQGTGINGKVFYPDEQAKIMQNLEQLYRLGRVDSIHLAKQRNSFASQGDMRVLPVSEKSPPKQMSQNQMVNGTRTYAY